MNQQGDVVLFQTVDDGNIVVTDGIVTMSGGLETAAYLSLFGGNEDDDGSMGAAFSWWGNVDAQEIEQYRSETQHLLDSLPPSSGNLVRIEDAARRDLAWFVTARVASSVTVNASIPGLNRVKLVVGIEAFGEESQFEFVENWRAST